MAAPEGYTELARIGFADQGNYAAGATYRKGDVVYYNGSTWAALKDNLKGVTPANGANWKYMARGFAAEKLEDVKAKDTSGVLGTTGAEVASQALIDAIADRVMTKLVERSSIVQTESTDPSTVPSSPYFKQVTDKLTSDLGELWPKNHIIAASTQVTFDSAGTSHITFPRSLKDQWYIVSVINITGIQASNLTATGFDVTKNDLAGKAAWVNYICVKTG